MLRTEARQTLSLAFPIILGELAQMSLRLIDTAMVGAVDYKQLAAVALVTSVINIPFVFGVGITLSVSQTVAMAHGRRNKALVSHYLFNGFWVCVVFALLISLGIEASRSIIFHLHQDPEVAALALPYLRLMGWSLVPMVLFLSLKQFTDGLEYTRIGMVLSLASLPLNAFINWLLIFGHWGFPRLEIAGAGWGTLITRVVIFGVLLGVIWKHSLFSDYIQNGKAEWRLRGATIRELLHIGIPSSLQISMEAGAFALSGILIGTFGAVWLAAHQVALSMASMTFMVSLGISQAGSIRTSNAHGRRDWSKVGLIGRSAVWVALGYGALCALAFIFLRRFIPLGFNDDPRVVEAAAWLLLFAAVFQVSDSTQAVSAGLLRGMKDMKVPTALIGIAYWVLGIPTGYVLAVYFHMGAAGIWMGLTIGLTFAALSLTTRFGKLISRKKVTSDNPSLA